jgi:hypothetical protein
MRSSHTPPVEVAVRPPRLAGSRTDNLRKRSSRVHPRHRGATCTGDAAGRFRMSQLQGGRVQRDYALRPRCGYAATRDARVNERAPLNQ